MARNRNRSTQPLPDQIQELVAEETVVQADPDAAAVEETVADPEDQDPEPEVEAEEPPAPRCQVWHVSIDRCLLGEQFVKADSAEEALAKYKAVSGITVHPAATIKETALDPDDLPEDVSLFGEPQ